MPYRYKAALLAASAALLATPALADGYENRPVNRGPAPLQAHAQQTPPEPGCYLVGHDTWSCPPLPQTAHRSHGAAHSSHHGYTSAPARSVSSHSVSHGGYASGTVSQSYAAAHAGHAHAYGAACGGGYNAIAARPAQVSYATHTAAYPATRSSSAAYSTRTVSHSAPRPVAVSRTATRSTGYATRSATRSTSYARRDVDLDISGFDGGVGNGVDGGYYGGGGGFADASASSSASALSSAAASFTFNGSFRGGGGGKNHGGGGCNTCGGGGHKGGGWKGGGHGGHKGGGHGGGRGGHKGGGHGGGGH